MDSLFSSTNIILVVILGLFKVIEYMASKTKLSVLTDKERHHLHSLFEMHDVRDEDGRHIWYMPKQVGQQQEKIIELLNEMSKTQNDTTHVLERILDRLDRAERTS